MFGHHYNEHLAVEIAYVDSGALHRLRKTTAWSIAVVGFVPLAANLEGYGRLGYAAPYRTKNAEGFSVTHGDITYGVGVNIA